MTTFSRRLLLLPLTLALAHCGGGGGGSSEPAPGTTPAVVTDPYAGTAYLKVQRTTHATGGGPGLGRAVVQGLVDLCNGHRSGHYGLPAQQPDEALMAGIDVQTIEHFYDNGKAADKTSGYSLDVYDLQRWLDDFKAGGTVPATPPDCSAVKKVELTSGTLWLDGVKYALRYDSKQALGNKGGASFTATAIDSDDKVAAWPKKTVLGESCSVASGPSIPTNLVQCLWDRFPAKTWLNLPWALESSGGAGQEVRDIALVVESNKPLPAGALDVPAGFTAKVD